jgi:hypothetical protein
MARQMFYHFTVLISALGLHAASGLANVAEILIEGNAAQSSRGTESSVVELGSWQMSSLSFSQRLR